MRRSTVRESDSSKRKMKHNINPKKENVHITNDQMNFLRQAEQENDIEVGVDEFGIGLVEQPKRKKQKPKPIGDAKKSKKLTQTKPIEGEVGKEVKETEGRKGTDESKTSVALVEVAHDLQELESDVSTSEQSTATVTNVPPPKEPPTKRKGLGSRVMDLFRKKEKQDIANAEMAIAAEEKLEKERKESDLAGKVPTEHARKIRAKLAKRRARVEHCTYHLLVAIIIIRLITTLTIIYEYEEFSITLEYLLRLRKVNCLEVYDWIIIDFWPIILLLYFTACCVLPTLTSRELTKACVVWMLIQILYTGQRFFIAQQFFFFREDVPLILPWFLGHCLLDVLSFSIVMIRYYFWANPCLERDRYSNTMLGDYLVNEYIQFMVQSSFIRKKTAVQRATAFQVMTVVRKIKEKYRASGDGPSEQSIQKEVKSAIHALQDWKKFPALRIIHSFEVKEKIMKEKLKLRRQRIRQMKDKFNKLLDKQKKKDAEEKMKKFPNKNAVMLNQQGQAVGIRAEDKHQMADLIDRLKQNKKQESYKNKRAAALNEVKNNIKENKAKNIKK